MKKVFSWPLPWNDHLYLGSVGYPALSHSTQPPFKAHTWGKPIFSKSCATLALVPSFFQAQ